MYLLDEPTQPFADMGQRRVVFFLEELLLQQTRRGSRGRSIITGKERTREKAAKWPRHLREKRRGRVFRGKRRSCIADKTNTRRGTVAAMASHREHKYEHSHLAARSSYTRYLCIHGVFFCLQKRNEIALLPTLYGMPHVQRVAAKLIVKSLETAKGYVPLVFDKNRALQ